MSETAIVNACLQILKLRGIFAWRNNTGMALYEGAAVEVPGIPAAGGPLVARRRPRKVRYGLKGSADIFAVLQPGGRFLAIECKHGKNQQTEAQMEFEIDINKAGGVYLVIRSWDELDEWIKQHVKDAA